MFFLAVLFYCIQPFLPWSSSTPVSLNPTILHPQWNSISLHSIYVDSGKDNKPIISIVLCVLFTNFFNFNSDGLLDVISFGEMLSTHKPLHAGVSYIYAPYHQISGYFTHPSHLYITCSNVAGGRAHSPGKTGCLVIGTGLSCVVNGF